MLGNTFIKHRIFEVFEVWFFEKSGSRKSGSVGADFGDFAVRRALHLAIWTAQILKYPRPTNNAGIGLGCLNRLKYQAIFR